MLSKLTISNYALIDRLETDFSTGLTAITGETGSGKSIMLGALSLLRGVRADSRVVRKPAGKAVVEAVFAMPPRSLRPVIEEAGCDWNDEELILRREVSSTGRSRAFVNDSPVKLQTLQALSYSLIDIHSQHETMKLADSSSQLRIIDAMAGNRQLLEDYRALYSKYVGLRRRLDECRRDIARNRENREFMLFQLEQLDRLKPRRGELDELERLYDIYSDAGEIKEQLSAAYGLIDGYDRSAVSLLAEVRSALGRLDLSLFEKEDVDSPGLQQRIETLYIELRDIASTIGDYASGVEADPARLAKISGRMDSLYEAQKRFKVEDNDALVDFHESLRQKVGPETGSSEEVESLESEIRELAPKLKTKALELSASRASAANEFSELLTATAKPLGLPNLKFSVLMAKCKPSSDGVDCISFLCRFNKNQELQPLENVASGGEMSRLMLSMKEILSSRLHQPTVVFDEIDTGVSGEIADRMGRMMKSMSLSTQVIAITHLPQVASKGDHHFRVYKTDNEESTVTRLECLDEAGRRRELAQMLSGDHVDEAAMRNASSLLASSHKGQTDPNQDNTVKNINE